MPTKDIEREDLTAEDSEPTIPPPPYSPSSKNHPSTTTSLSNPGFCPLAFTERQANRVPGGGLPSSTYLLPCASCSLTIGSTIPASYKLGWKDWVDPSLNFRWESHVPQLETEKGELLGCWICWENEGTWVRPMEPEDWYTHMRNHFRNDRYMVCRGQKGMMQRRRNCPVKECARIHS